jgi:hypothetical protein
VSAPPLPTLLAYRLLGWRLGPEHQAWTHADITGRWYLVKQGLTLDGEVDTAATSWFADDEARRKRSLSGAVATVLLVLVGLLVIGLGPTG